MEILDIKGHPVNPGDTIHWVDKDFTAIVELKHDFPGMPDNFYKPGDDFLSTASPYGARVRRIVKPKNKYNLGFEII